MTVGKLIRLLNACPHDDKVTIEGWDIKEVIMWPNEVTIMEEAPHE